MHASSYISICLPLRSHPMAMRQSKLRAVSARPWLLLLCLALAATAGVMQARAQPNSIGNLMGRAGDRARIILSIYDPVCLRIDNCCRFHQHRLWFPGDDELRGRRHDAAVRPGRCVHRRRREPQRLV
jgi:hypothetical protein